MCDPARGGIDPSRAFLLNDLQERDTDKPTRPNIEARLQQIGKEAQPGDTLLFFFSGHGVVRDGKTYLLTRDAAKERLNQTALDRAALDVMLQRLRERGVSVVIFLDACHSGGLEAEAENGEIAGGAPLAGADYERLLNDLSSHTMLFASCAADQISYEDPVGLEAGVFGHYLFEGLSGKADADQDGVVRLGEVAGYVEAGVRGWCDTRLEGSETQQRPVRLPDRWTSDLPLAFDPDQLYLEAGRAALKRLGAKLTPAERRDAETALRTREGVLLAEWLPELEAAGTTAAAPVTLEQYRAFRRVVIEEPSSPRAGLYRHLPPRQALSADALLSLPGDAGVAWRHQAENLARGLLKPEDFTGWMDDWLELHPNPVARG